MTGRGRLFVAAGVLVALTGLTLGLHDLTKVGATADVNEMTEPRMLDPASMSWEDRPWRANMTSASV